MLGRLVLETSDGRNYQGIATAGREFEGRIQGLRTVAERQQWPMAPGLTELTYLWLFRGKLVGPSTIAVIARDLHPKMRNVGACLGTPVIAVIAVIGKGGAPQALSLRTIN